MTLKQTWNDYESELIIAECFWDVNPGIFLTLEGQDSLPDRKILKKGSYWLRTKNTLDLSKVGEQ